MHGTELVYDPTRCPVLSSRMVLPGLNGELPTPRDTQVSPAIPYAVLRWRMLLRACYAMSGTDLGHGAIPCATSAPCALSGTELAYGAITHYAMSGPELAYGATILCAIRYCYSACCYLPTRLLCDVRY
eukprot:1967522-Rhodomonas_salina.1